MKYKDLNNLLFDANRLKTVDFVIFNTDGKFNGVAANLAILDIGLVRNGMIDEH